MTKGPNPDMRALLQQAQQMQMMDKAIPAGASAAGKMANENPEQLQAMAGAMQQGMQQ